MSSKIKKPKSVEQLFLNELIKRLNRLVAKSNTTIARLIEKRISTGTAFKDDDLIVTTSKGYVGLLGVLNGLRTSNDQLICANYLEHEGNEILVSFSLIAPEDGNTHV